MINRHFSKAASNLIALTGQNDKDHKTIQQFLCTFAEHILLHVAPSDLEESRNKKPVKDIVLAIDDMNYTLISKKNLRFLLPHSIIARCLYRSLEQHYFNTIYYHCPKCRYFNGPKSIIINGDLFEHINEISPNIFEDKDEVIKSIKIMEHVKLIKCTKVPDYDIYRIVFLQIDEE